MIILAKANNKLLCAELGGGDVLNARTDPAHPGGWEELAIEHVGNQIAWRTEGGFYITAELDGTVAVTRRERGPWELWTPVRSGAGVAYLSAHGLFLCADLTLPVSSPDWSGHRVVANRPWFGPWETFNEGVPQPADRIFPLRVRDDCFERADGMRVTAIQTTDFRLLKRVLDGEDVSPVLRDRRDLGFNMTRVVGTCHNMFRLYPEDYTLTEYLSAIRTLAHQLALHDQVLELTMYADAPHAYPDPNFQRDLWTAVDHIDYDEDNVIGELVNENDVHWNTIDTAKFTPWARHLCSHGSNGSGAIPVRTPDDHGWWDYENSHWNDQFEWWRKMGHNGMEMYTGTQTEIGSRQPNKAGENTRPDKDLLAFNNDPARVLAHMEDGAAGCTLLNAGGCFHSEAGKASIVFDGFDRQCAEAWVKGARSVPLDAQGQPYRRRDDLLEPGLLRVYQRGFASSHIVRIRK